MVRRYIVIILILSILIVSASFSAEISISRINNAKGGERKTLTVSADSIASQISAFNLLIAYDQSLNYVYAVRPGDLHKNYGWEYFTYRLITRDTVAAHMPGYNVHLINIIGLSSLTGNPLALNIAGSSLASFEVLLRHTSNGIYDEWMPFSFFWRDCNDNVLTSFDGSTLFTADGLYRNQSSLEPREPQSFSFPGYGFSQEPCTGQHGETVLSNVDFVNAGIWTFQYDGVEDCYNGDINLNGIHYEIADAVAFIDYFMNGICIFSCCPDYPPDCPYDPIASMAQTDCNCDGLILSVGDVVCFIRKAIGDYWFNKIPVTLENNALIFTNKSNNSQKVSLSTDADIALTYLRVFPKDEDQVSLDDFNFTQPLLRTGQIGDTITLMLVDLGGNSVLSGGEYQLFDYSGNSELEIEAWVVDMSGNETALKLESSVLPESPELLQNYPNPFNPTTTIEFSLPSNTEWKLEIYNVTGQLIRKFSGNAIGAVRLEWDGKSTEGAEMASGVYLYKLIIGDVTTSRKMLLLK